MPGTGHWSSDPAVAIERYALLLDAGQALESARDRDEAATALLGLLLGRVGEVVVVAVREADGPRVAAFDAVDEERRAALAIGTRSPQWGAEGGLGEVLRTGEVLVLPPVDVAFVRRQSATDEARDAAEVFAGHGFFIVPLVAGGEVVGALAVGRRGPVSEADVELLADVGLRAGQAVAALGRLEAEREQRRAAEEAGSTLDELVRSAPLGIAFFGTDLRYRRLNARLEEVNGLPEAHHLGRLPTEVLPAGGPEIEAALRAVLATGEPRQDELVVRLPGSPDRDRTFSCGFHRVALPGGEPLGVGATVFELTDRLEAEAALQAQRDQYASLLDAADSLGEGVFELGGLRLEWVNDAACAISGRSREALLALPSVLDLVMAEDLPSVAERLDELLVGGGTMRFDARLQRPDGHVVWVELAGRSLLADDGRPRTIGVVRDIDARKQAELAREREHRRTSLLADLSSLLEASLDLRALTGGAARLVVEREVAEACAVELGEPGAWRRAAVAPERADLSGEIELPLVSGGEQVGRMLLDGARDPALAGELAARVAPVVVNARLYEERVRVARVLQDGLLPPRLPAVPGVEAATVYAPGAARLDVGGDFYDLFGAGDGVWNAVVGDVCGKGAEAAAMTALARHTLRALAAGGTDPADLLGALNGAILRDAHRDERFITMVLCRLLPRPGGLRLDVACAGHPPPVLARATGALEEVRCRGVALGVVPGAQYRTAHVDLEAGDVVVLFTDGLSEAARARTGEGYRDVVRERRPEGPRAVADALRTWAAEQRDGGEAGDDLALLVLQVSGDAT